MNMQTRIHSSHRLTFKCLFLHRSQALLEGTPGIVSLDFELAGGYR